MLLNDNEGASHLSVISITWLSIAGVGCPEVPDMGEYPQDIYDHGQGTPLGHPLIDVKEVTRLVALQYHQCGPVAVAVKCKPCTTGPSVEHLQQHCCKFFLIERIARFNEEKPPVLLLGVLLPQEPQHMNLPLDPRFQPPTELLIHCSVTK